MRDLAWLVLCVTVFWFGTGSTESEMLKKIFDEARRVEREALRSRRLTQALPALERKAAFVDRDEVKITEDESAVRRAKSAAEQADLTQKTAEEQRDIAKAKLKATSSKLVYTNVILRRTRDRAHRLRMNLRRVRRYAGRQRRDLHELRRHERKLNRKWDFERQEAEEAEFNQQQEIARFNVEIAALQARNLKKYEKNMKGGLKATIAHLLEKPRHESMLIVKKSLEFRKTKANTAKVLHNAHVRVGKLSRKLQHETLLRSRMSEKLKNVTAQEMRTATVSDKVKAQLVHTLVNLKNRRMLNVRKLKAMEATKRNVDAAIAKLRVKTVQKKRMIASQRVRTAQELKAVRIKIEILRHESEKARLTTKKTVVKLKHDRAQITADRAKTRHKLAKMQARAAGLTKKISLKRSQFGMKNLRAREEVTSLRREHRMQVSKMSSMLLTNVKLKVDRRVALRALKIVAAKNAKNVKAAARWEAKLAHDAEKVANKVQLLSKDLMAEKRRVQGLIEALKRRRARIKRESKTIDVNTHMYKQKLDQLSKLISLEDRHLRKNKRKVASLTLKLDRMKYQLSLELRRERLQRLTTAKMSAIKAAAISHVHRALRSNKLLLEKATAVEQTKSLKLKKARALYMHMVQKYEKARMKSRKAHHDEIIRENRYAKRLTALLTNEAKRLQGAKKKHVARIEDLRIKDLSKVRKGKMVVHQLVQRKETEKTTAANEKAVALLSLKVLKAKRALALKTIAKFTLSEAKHVAALRRKKALLLKSVDSEKTKLAHLSQMIKNARIMLSKMIKAGDNRKARKGLAIVHERVKERSELRRIRLKNELATEEHKRQLAKMQKLEGEMTKKTEELNQAAGKLMLHKVRAARKLKGEKAKEHVLVEKMASYSKQAERAKMASASGRTILTSETHKIKLLNTKLQVLEEGIRKVGAAVKLERAKEKEWSSHVAASIVNAKKKSKVVERHHKKEVNQLLRTVGIEQARAAKVAAELKKEKAEEGRTLGAIEGGVALMKAKYVAKLKAGKRKWKLESEHKAAFERQRFERMRKKISGQVATEHQILRNLVLKSLRAKRRWLHHLAVTKAQMAKDAAIEKANFAKTIAYNALLLRRLIKEKDVLLSQHRDKRTMQERVVQLTAADKRKFEKELLHSRKLSKDVGKLDREISHAFREREKHTTRYAKALKKKIAALARVLVTNKKVMQHFMSEKNELRKRVEREREWERKHAIALEKAGAVVRSKLTEIKKIILALRSVKGKVAAGIRDDQRRKENFLAAVKSVESRLAKEVAKNHVLAGTFERKQIVFKDAMNTNNKTFAHESMLLRKEKAKWVKKMSNEKKTLAHWYERLSGAVTQLKSMQQEIQHEKVNEVRLNHLKVTELRKLTREERKEAHIHHDITTKLVQMAEKLKKENARIAHSLKEQKAEMEQELMSHRVREANNLVQHKAKLELEKKQLRHKKAILVKTLAKMRAKELHELNSKKVAEGKERQGILAEQAQLSHKLRRVSEVIQRIRHQLAGDVRKLTDEESKRSKAHAHDLKFSKQWARLAAEAETLDRERAKTEKMLRVQRINTKRQLQGIAARRQQITRHFKSLRVQAAQTMKNEKVRAATELARQEAKETEELKTRADRRRKLVEKSRMILAKAAATLVKMKDEAGKRLKHERTELSNMHRREAAKAKRILGKLQNATTAEAEMVLKHKEKEREILRESKASAAEHTNRLAHLRAREARRSHEKLGNQVKLKHVRARVSELLRQIKVKRQEAAHRVEELSKAAANLVRLGDEIHHRKMEGVALEGDIRRATHELVHLRQNGVGLSNELSGEMTKVAREAKEENLKLAKLGHKFAHLRTVNAPIKHKEAVVSKHIKKAKKEEAAIQRGEIKAERKFRKIHGKEMQEARKLRSRKAKIATTRMEITAEQRQLASFPKVLQQDKLKEVALKKGVFTVGKKDKSLAMRVASLSAKLQKGRSDVEHVAHTLKHARAELRHIFEIEKAQHQHGHSLMEKYLREKVRTRQLFKKWQAGKRQNQQLLKPGAHKFSNGTLQVLVHRLTLSRDRQGDLAAAARRQRKKIESHIAKLMKKLDYDKLSMKRYLSFQQAQKERLARIGEKQYHAKLKIERETRESRKLREFIKLHAGKKVVKSRKVLNAKMVQLLNEKKRLEANMIKIREENGRIHKQYMEETRALTSANVTLRKTIFRAYVKVAHEKEVIASLARKLLASGYSRAALRKLSHAKQHSTKR